MTGGGVVDLELGLGSVQSHIEFQFTDIDSGANNATINHLRPSQSCYANLKFVQPSGSDEEPIAITLRNSPTG
jgi:hypothetical protein